MFTGLVEGVGRVVEFKPVGPETRMMIAPPWDTAEVVMGESVSVNGACLTVTGIDSRGFWVQMSAETLARTTLGGLETGAMVNLERALRLGDRLGGHLVTGHVDCVGTVEQLAPVGPSRRMRISIPREHLKFLVPKGSVAVEGVSLTVNEVGEGWFEVNIIPHTLEATTLRLVKQGSYVNIETDLIGKYVARLVGAYKAEPEGGKGISEQQLRDLGF